jgi:hypothetical protein
LTSSRTSVDLVEQSRIDYRYSSDGQVIVEEKQSPRGGHPKVTTTRIQSNLFGYVAREWRQVEGQPEKLVGRYEYDDRGRIARVVFLSGSTNEIFTHEFTYSQADPAWRTRSITGPDGRLISKTITFLSPSGRPVREESSDHPDDSSGGSALALPDSPVSVSEYDEQGCLVRFGHKKSSKTDGEWELVRSIERDASGIVVGWQELRSSGSPRVMRPTRHVRIELKYRTVHR